MIFGCITVVTIKYNLAISVITSNFLHGIMSEFFVGNMFLLNRFMKYHSSISYMNTSRIRYWFFQQKFFFNFSLIYLVIPSLNNDKGYGFNSSLKYHSISSSHFAIAKNEL